MIIDTIAEIPELGADYIQLVIENVQKGNVETDDIQNILTGLGSLATHQSVYILSWLYRSQPKSGVIFPEKIHFSFGSADTPYLHIPVEGQEHPLRVGPNYYLTGHQVCGASAS